MSKTLPLKFLGLSFSLKGHEPKMPSEKYCAADETLSMCLHQPTPSFVIIVQLYLAQILFPIV